MRKHIRNILKGLSFTSVLFIFQACYGTPQDFESSIFIECNVKNSEGKPVEGIQLSDINGEAIDEITNSDGYCSFYHWGRPDTIKLTAIDTDSEMFGAYKSKNIFISDYAGDSINISIELSSK